MKASVDPIPRKQLFQRGGPSCPLHFALPASYRALTSFTVLFQCSEVCVHTPQWALPSASIEHVPDWVTCPFLDNTHRDPLAGEADICAHWLRQSDPSPQLPSGRGGWGADWELAPPQGLYTDLCPSWGHALEQSSTQCKALSSSL